ncbi:MAG: hypothetical protein VKI42_01150 [Synechococcaceae cyanobacterium]|nr:hypothetical protein [Synechococcaceae cyanobacterium]
MAPDRGEVVWARTAADDSPIREAAATAALAAAAARDRAWCGTGWTIRLRSRANTWHFRIRGGF